MAMSLEDAFSKSGGDEWTPEQEQSDEQDQDLEGEDEDTEDDSVEDDSEDTEVDSDESEDDEGDDIPDKYFGVDLSGLPEDAKRGVYDSLRNKDKYTNRLSQEKSGLEKEVAELREFIQSQFQGEPENDGGEFQMPSDDEITEYLTKEYGLDKDDPFYEIQVKSALPGVKAALQSNHRADQMQQQLELQQYASHYMGTIDRLERKHGDLPISREDFMAWAAENDLGDPTEAFTTFQKAAKGIFEDETSSTRKAKEAARRELKKKSASTKRKSSAGQRPSKPERPTLDDALAFAVKETGYNFEGVS